MSETDFPTTVLTSKSPAEVADFLPHSLELSSRLIEKNLSVWFANYAAMISRYNKDLNSLVVNGRTFFSEAGNEFGSLDRIWNCLASSVMGQVQVNESLINVIKKDVLGQFQGALKNDFKYSELLVNSEELLEMQNYMDDADGAYKWNVKAPGILGNFENYKKFEKDLIFSAFISYLNTFNTKTSGLVHKNENAVNFILKEYSIDNEMRLYTDYMIKANVPSAERKKAPEKGSENTSLSPQRPQAISRPSMTSTNSGHTARATPVKEKRKSKLRSKMGSFLGRKKTSTTTSHAEPIAKPVAEPIAETIPEDNSVKSVPSRQNTFISRSNTRNSMKMGMSGPGSIAPRGGNDSRNEHAQAITKPSPKSNGMTTQSMTPKKMEAPMAAQPTQEFKPSFNTVPLQPMNPSSPIKQPQPIEPAQPSQHFDVESVKSSQTEEPNNPPENNKIGGAEEEANFVKYSSSEDESDAPISNAGKRLSLLDAHDLGPPPKFEIDSDSRSRNTSSGKYSFEYGDETKSISTPQRHTPIVEVAPQYEFAAEIGIETKAHPARSSGAEIPDRVLEPPAVGPFVNRRHSQSISSVRQAPPPPPSRKAHLYGSEVQRDDLYNPVNPRDSYIWPHATGNDRMSLISQTTGNSMRQDYFKHFGASESITREGLNTSIAEIISARFEDGKAVSTQILGEIAFNYISNEPLESLTINIPTQFTKFHLNDQFVVKHGIEKYTLNLAHIAGKTLGGIKYSLDSDAINVPVIVKQIWKFESNQASLIIKVSLNSACNDAIRLENFSVAASLDKCVSSISASSKPEGSFNKELNRITWRYIEPLVLSPTSPELKFIARIITKGLAKEAPSGVKLRFTISDGSPNVQIFDSAYRPVPSITSLTSGNYSSHV